MPFRRLTDSDAILAHADRHDLTPLALSPAGTETLAALPPPPGRCCSSAPRAGLPPALMANLRTLRIPMAPDFDSLNVATAGAIALHHLRAAG